MQGFSQRPEVKDGILGTALGYEVRGVGAGLTRGADLLGRAAPSSLTEHLLEFFAALLTKHEDEESPIASAPEPLGVGLIYIDISIPFSSLRFSPDGK